MRDIAAGADSEEGRSIAPRAILAGGSRRVKEGGGAFDGGADTVVDMAGGIREKGSALGNMGVAGTGSEFSWEDVYERGTD